MCWQLWALCLLAACPMARAEGEVRGRALIVGVGRYDDESISALRYTTADADLLASLLADPRRGVFPTANVRILTDDTPEKPDRAHILAGLEWLSQAGEDEAILFYFSGHGMVDDKERQYLISCDTRADSPAITAVPVAQVNEILDDLSKTKARQIVVLLDACHSGVRRGAKATSTEAGRVVARLMADAEGRITFSSCGMEEQSFEDDEKKHGVFTYFLAQGLRGEADADGDGLIGIGELNPYVREKVTGWAREKRVRQTPWVQARISGEVYLAKDPAKWEAAVQAKSERRAALSRLRGRLLSAIGEGTGKLPAREGSLLLGAIDRTLGESAEAADAKLVALAERYASGALAPEAFKAEVLALSGPAAGPAAQGGGAVTVQLFQPEWQSGGSADEMTIECAPGEEVKVVGLAESPRGISRVLLDGQPLAAGSLSARTVVVVARRRPDTGAYEAPPAGSQLRFEGSLRAGDEPRTAVLAAMDAGGASRLLLLHLKTRPGAPAKPRDTVAVIGLSKRAVDEYPELRALRVGQGLNSMLGRVARESGRFRLVEEKAEVLRGIIDRQTMQNAPEFDQATAVTVGKLLGARYVIYGEVYDFASPKENRGKLYVAVQVRLVDVETAAYRPGDGEATLVVPKSQPGEVEFDRSSLGQVSRDAITAALADLLKE